MLIDTSTSFFDSVIGYYTEEAIETAYYYMKGYFHFA